MMKYLHVAAMASSLALAIIAASVAPGTPGYAPAYNGEQK